MGEVRSHQGHELTAIPAKGDEGRWQVKSKVHRQGKRARAGHNHAWNRWLFVSRIVEKMCACCTLGGEVAGVEVGCRYAG